MHSALRCFQRQERPPNFTAPFRRSSDCRVFGPRAQGFRDSSPWMLHDLGSSLLHLVGGNDEIPPKQALHLFISPPPSALSTRAASPALC